ncbi:MAG: glycosyltransferase, partial [Fusobacteriaceae bacterium]|nr:glycosyltransferase [Fusobacteriaceae bacterium]
MKPLLSIIVPVYNTEKYIEKTIKSILSQKLQNFELILVDDGSPDNCGVICDMYAKIDSRIKVIHKENGGLSSARNAGLDEAEGDYIGFVDSDDYLEPFMYKKLVDAIILGNGDISFCRLKRITKDCEYFFHKRLKIEEVISGEELLRLIFLSKIDASSCTKIFKKDFFRARRFQVGITNEDFELFYKSLATVKKVIYVEDTYYAYQERENSITTGTKFKKDLFNNICNMKKYI